MIHYHGTPIGGTEKDAIEFMRHNRHCLIPFAYPNQLPVAMMYGQSFIVDNSAFTYWKSGESLDVQAYIDWVSTIHRHPGFDWCLIPDVIDGTEDENRKLITTWMRSGTRIKGVPVYHFHESLRKRPSFVRNRALSSLAGNIRLHRERYGRSVGFAVRQVALSSSNIPLSSSHYPSQGFVPGLCAARALP